VSGGEGQVSRTRRRGIVAGQQAVAGVDMCGQERPSMSISL